MDSGSSYRSDDNGWRNGAHASLSDQGLPNSDDCCVSCGCGRTCDDQLHPAQVYGFAIPAGYVSSADRWSAGVVDRNIDWEFVTAKINGTVSFRFRASRAGFAIWI